MVNEFLKKSCAAGWGFIIRGIQCDTPAYVTDWSLRTLRDMARGIPDVMRGESEGPTLPNNWHLGHPLVCNPNGISIGSAVFPGLLIVCNTQTDTQTSLRQRMRSNTPLLTLVLATCAKKL